MTQSPLTDDDQAGLDSNFPSCWELVTADGGAMHGVIISDYLLPDDIYTTEKTDLMVIVPNGYPMSSMDMFYCNPGLARKDGRAIIAVGQEQHFDRSWLKWSRHYDPDDKWVPGVHNIITHLEFVKNQLRYDQA